MTFIFRYSLVWLCLLAALVAATGCAGRKFERTTWFKEHAKKCKARAEAAAQNSSPLVYEIWVGRISELSYSEFFSSHGLKVESAKRLIGDKEVFVDSEPFDGFILVSMSPTYLGKYELPQIGEQWAFFVHRYTNDRRAVMNVESALRVQKRD